MSNGPKYYLVLDTGNRYSPLMTLRIIKTSPFISNTLRYDLTDTAGVLENKGLGMLHGLDDYSVLVEGFWQSNFLCKLHLKWRQEIARR